MEYHRISGILGSKGLTKVGLVLFMNLRPMRIHAITHRDVFRLSSLKERGILDISKVKVFL